MARDPTNLEWYLSLALVMKGIEGSILSCNRENVHNSMIFFFSFFSGIFGVPIFLFRSKMLGK